MAIRWLLLIGLGLIAGCGHGPEFQRAIVSGRVSYQGRPVADGTIRFVPVKGTKGPAAIARIEDGDYTVTLHEGVPVGTHRVEIEAFRPVAPPAVPHPRDRQAKQQYLPRQYNRESTLEVTIDGEGKQTYDFDLK